MVRTEHLKLEVIVLDLILPEVLGRGRSDSAEREETDE